MSVPLLEKMRSMRCRLFGFQVLLFHTLSSKPYILPRMVVKSSEGGVTGGKGLSHQVHIKTSRKVMFALRYENKARIGKPQFWIEMLRLH